MKNTVIRLGLLFLCFILTGCSHTKSEVEENVYVADYDNDGIEESFMIRQKEMSTDADSSLIMNQIEIVYKDNKDIKVDTRVVAIDDYYSEEYKDLDYTGEWIIDDAYVTEYDGKSVFVQKLRKIDITGAGGYYYKTLTYGVSDGEAIKIKESEGWGDFQITTFLWDGSISEVTDTDFLNICNGDFSAVLETHWHGDVTKEKLQDYYADVIVWKEDKRLNGVECDIDKDGETELYIWGENTYVFDKTNEGIECIFDGSTSSLDGGSWLLQDDGSLLKWKSEMDNRLWSIYIISYDETGTVKEKGYFTKAFESQFEEGYIRNGGLKNDFDNDGEDEFFFSVSVDIDEDETEWQTYYLDEEGYEIVDSLCIYGDDDNDTVKGLFDDNWEPEQSYLALYKNQPVYVQMYRRMIHDSSNVWYMQIAYGCRDGKPIVIYAEQGRESKPRTVTYKYDESIAEVFDEEFLAICEGDFSGVIGTNDVTVDEMQVYFEQNLSDSGFQGYECDIDKDGINELYVMGGFGTETFGSGFTENGVEVAYPTRMSAVFDKQENGIQCMLWGEDYYLLENGSIAQATRGYQGGVYEQLSVLIFDATGSYTEESYLEIKVETASEVDYQWCVENFGKDVADAMCTEEGIYKFYNGDRISDSEYIDFLDPIFFCISD